MEVEINNSIYKLEYYINNFNKPKFVNKSTTNKEYALYIVPNINNNNININNNNETRSIQNINMDTVIKPKNTKSKNLQNNKEETINNFSSYIKNENPQFLNNQTHLIPKNENNLKKKHLRRCSINTRPENFGNNCFQKNFCIGPENHESLKKISIEFLKKIFDLNAPIASKRKHLLKEFLNKKLGKKICEDVQALIEKQGESLTRESLNSAILGLIGKENENYILIFNYLFNPDSLCIIKKGKN